MSGEFCLMRGVDETSLLSVAEDADGTCVIRASADHRTIAIKCSIDSLTSVESGGSAHLAGPEGLCAIERERGNVRFRFITSDRRSRSYEIEATRFDAAIAMLAAGMSFASLK